MYKRVADVAADHGVSRQTVYDWIADYTRPVRIKWKFVRVGNRQVMEVDTETVNQYLEEKKK